LLLVLGVGIPVASSGIARMLTVEGPCAEACDGPPNSKAVMKFICLLQLHVGPGYSG